MLYFDTSFLVPLVLAEVRSARIQQFISGLPREHLVTSHWTRVEFSSGIGREVRMGHMEAREAAEVDTRFEALVMASFRMLTPTVGDYVRAKSFIGNYATGLRAPDALHLAIATNNAADRIFTLDNGMLAAGTILGLPTSLGIET
jgi:uncharacterized protein